MHYTLTKEEAERSVLEYDEWWAKLGMCDKSSIFHFCKDVIGSRTIVSSTKDLDEIRKDRAVDYQKTMAVEFKASCGKAKSD